MTNLNRPPIETSIKALKEIARLADKAYGTPNDFTNLCGKVAKTALFLIEEAAANPSEISVIEAFEKDKAKYHAEWSDPDCPITQEEDLAYKAGWNDRHRASLKPVSVDLLAKIMKEKLSDGMGEYQGVPIQFDNFPKAVKAVLDAVGVPYAD